MIRIKLDNDAFLSETREVPDNLFLRRDITRVNISKKAVMTISTIIPRREPERRISRIKKTEKTA
jgi:hypothetical protein